MGKAFRKRNNQRTHKRPKNNPKQHSSHSSDGCTIFLKHRRVLEEPKENLKEEQVGITEFVTTGKGVTGVVKARFSDFHVNEIDQNGKVLQLDDLNIPQPKENGLDEEELAKAKCELNDVITSEVWDRIEALAQRKHQDAGAERSIELDVSTLDKEQRTKIHNIIKKLYERTLVSTTTNSVQEGEEEKKIVKIYPKKGKGDTRNRWGFPGEYVHFLVHKENMDTSEVASIMAGRLGLRPSQVNYCGTKDKRAKTTQKFCVKRRSPSAIVSSMKGSNGVHIGNFEFHAEVLKLGQLRGNRFRIALRLVGGENADIEAALQEIKERGFINYYGLQRFGNCASVPTYEIGIALLKCDYKLACELIMKPRENDAPFLREIRKEWWTNRNSTVAAAKFYSDKFIEKKLLSGLAQYGENDYASALRKIPRNMLLLYPHAFQSLLFNRIVSRRIKEFGLKLIPGDLVFRNKDEPDTEIITEIVSTEDDTESSEKIEPLGATLTDTNKTETVSTQDDTESSEKIEPLDATLTDTNKTETVSTQDDTESSEIMEPLDANITDPNKAEIESKEEGKETITETELKEEGKETITETESKEEGKETITETEDKESVFKRKVKPLTAEDVASGEWTLFDVVLPLPGFDVTFPENEVAKWYEELLEEYGLSIAKLKHNVKTYSMPGAYRKIIIKPEEMKWEFKKYDKPESTLIASDWELLGRNKEQVLLNIKTVDGKFKAVLIDVKLPTAAYATMFLRELLKSDTSAASQSQLERAEMIKHNEKPPDEQFEDVKLKAEKREHKKDDSVGDKNGVEVEANDAKKMKPGEDSGE